MHKERIQVPKSKTLTIREIQKYDPFRTPAWRHDRVTELIEREPRRGRPSRVRDDADICTYYNFRLILQRASTEKVKLALYAENGPLCQAHDWYINGDHERRAILEARILARQSDGEIAQLVGLLPAAVAWYERIFFNVRDRLHARIWILKTIRGGERRRPLSCNDPLSASERGQFFKLLAHFGGPVALDAAISGLSGGPVAQQDQVPNWFDDSQASRILQVAVLSVREPDQASAMQLLRVQMKLLRCESASENRDSAAALEKNLEAFFAHPPWGADQR